MQKTQVADGHEPKLAGWVELRHASGVEGQKVSY